MGSEQMDRRGIAGMRPIIPAVAAAGAALPACLALVGWASGHEALRSVGQPVSMNPMTAVALLAAAAALGLLYRPAPAWWGRRVGQVLALLVVGVAVLKLAGAVAGIDVRVDTILFRSRLGGNQMAPNTALELLLLGAAIWLLDVRVWRGRAVSASLALIAGAIALVAVAGYCNGVGTLVGVASFIPMALNSAASFLVLSVGVMLAGVPGAAAAEGNRDAAQGANQSLGRNITVGFAAALLLLLVITVISLQSLQQFISNNGWEEHTRQVLMAIAEAGSGIRDAQEAGRGGATGGDERSRAAYRAASELVQSKLHDLRVLTADNPRQQQRLDGLEPLVQDELSLIARIAKARQEEGPAAAERLSSGQGERLMQEVQRGLSQMRDEEDDLLRVRSRTAVSSAKATMAVISCGGAVAVALVALAAWLIRRDIGSRNRSETALRLAEERFRLMIDGIRDYAIFMLDPTGHIAGWNPGAQRIKGYTAEEIVGQHFSRFYTPEDLEAGKPQRELEIATKTGRYEEEGWRVRKDGTRFWANVVISAARDESGTLRGFAKVTRDVSERKRAEDHIKKLNASLQAHASQVEATNKELEAFCYSVSHDLRAPLRSIDGFSVALLEDYGDKLEPEAQDYLKRVRAATQRMAQLIDDLLNLSRVSRGEIARTRVNLSEMARAVETELRKLHPDRKVEMVIADGLSAEGDPRLLRVVLDNLMGNAWKFTSKRPDARVEFGAEGDNGSRRFFIRDNGAGFDMTYVHKLFGAFQRLHANSEFGGTGVGLATVQRIIHRHGGTISAEGQVNKGATFHFSL